MKLTDKEVMNEINQHRVIIIAGTTTGRTRIRKLLVENLGQQRIIDTRNYIRNQYLQSQKDGRLIEVYPCYMIHRKEEYKKLCSLLDILKRKKKPVIVDSFSDIQLLVRSEFIRTVGRKVDEHNFQVYDRDWNIYKRMLKVILIKLKKQKKKVILFADLKEETEFKNNKLVHIGEKPVINQIFIHEADLIILADDNDNTLIKSSNKLGMLHIEPSGLGMGKLTTRKVKP